MKIGTIILGAGNSTRFNAKENKIFMKINNKYILEYSIDTFLKIDEIINIIVVYNKKDYEKIKILKDKYKKIIFVEGGNNRQQSLINGINNLKEDLDKIIIHDAARPLIYTDILKNMIIKSKNTKALIPVRRAIEGMKKVKDGIIYESLDRDQVVSCQTPQIFDTKIVYQLKDNTNKGIITFLLENNIKMDVYYLEKNILKITTIEDFYYYDYLIKGGFNEKN